MNKEFFRGMKEQIEPDEEQVEELKNKLKNTAAVSRKPMWIGGVVRRHCAWQLEQVCFYPTAKLIKTA